MAQRLSRALEIAAEKIGDAEETPEAERIAKAASAIAKALSEINSLAAYAEAQAPDWDVETIRAELERRIAGYVAAGRPPGFFGAADAE